MTFEQIGVLLSLLLTVLGWSITAYYQKRILNHQIAADRQKEARQLVLPQKIQRLNEMKDWIQRALTICLTGTETPEEVQRLYSEWKSHELNMYMLAVQLDAATITILPEKNREPLSQMIRNLKEQFEAYIFILGHDVITEADIHNIYAVGIRVGAAAFNAIMRLDDLIEITATQKVLESDK